MSNKQKCIEYCKEFLQMQGYEGIYSEKEFEHYYRKHNCAGGNAFAVGMNAGDYILLNYFADVQAGRINPIMEQYDS